LAPDRFINSKRQGFIMASALNTSVPAQGMRGISIFTIARAQPLLFWSGVAMLALLLPSSLGLWLDARTLNGISVWIKPMKFQASAGVYLITLAAFFLALPAGADKTRAGRYVVWAAVIAAFFEVGYITLQGARGVASHWNFSSAFTIAMYSLMGVGALVLNSAALVQGFMIARRGIASIHPALRQGLALGLILTFVLGATFGGIMSAGSGHWVGGTPSDANGLPIFKWSRDGGDLRVAHFFGIHAMHFIPAFAWLASRMPSTQAARAAVWAFTAAFTLLTVFTFAQAMLGRPFV
jgi:hypothetical protein